MHFHLKYKFFLGPIMLFLLCACESDREYNYGHRRRHLFFRTHRAMFSPLDTLNVSEGIKRDLEDIRYKKLELKYYTAKQWKARMEATPEMERRSKFRMRPGTTFELEVLDEADISGRYTVGPDGSLSISLVKDPIYVEGKTYEETRAAIVGALKAYIKSPEVTVNAVLLKSNDSDTFEAGKALLFGSFAGSEGEGSVSATTVGLSGDTNFMELVASLGGINGRADMQNIVILRQIDGEINVIIVDFQRLYQFADLGQNIKILDGDIILMPDRENSFGEQLLFEWGVLLELLTGLVTWDFAIEQFKEHNFLFY